MSTPACAWCLNHVLRDVQNVCALTKVGTVLKNELNWSFYVYFFFCISLSTSDFTQGHCKNKEVSAKEAIPTEILEVSLAFIMCISYMN